MADITARLAVRAYRRPGSSVTGLRGLIHVNCDCRVTSTLVGTHDSAKAAEAEIRDMGYPFNYCRKSTHTASQESRQAAPAPAVAAAPVAEEPASVEPTVEDGPRVHRFDDTDTAYDITQTEEGVRRGIRDGDVLVVESESVVGVLTNAWPVALTEAHGQFHLMSERYLIREMNDGRYAASADTAERVAAELGLPLLPQHRAATTAAPVTSRERDVIEGVVVTHDGTAQGSLPEDASDPDVAAARDALAGLAVATLTDHHDVITPKGEERDVRGYFVEPRGRGRVAVYWLEAGKVVRRDEAVNGTALDCLADRLQRRGWRTERMLPSSQCVFAYRPAEEAASAVVEQPALAASAPGTLVDPWTWIRRPASSSDTSTAAPTTVEQPAAEPTPAIHMLGRRKLAANRCVHNLYAAEAVAGDPVTACATKEPTADVGVFSDEGCVIYFDCAVQAANEAVRLDEEDEEDEAAREQAAGGEPFHTWSILCREHHEQPADRCEECLMDTDADTGDGDEDNDSDEDQGDGGDTGCSRPRGESSVYAAHHRTHCEPVSDDIREQPALGAPLLMKGDRVVCADGVARTVEAMAPRVAGEPERVVVEGGASWLAADCLRANEEDVRAAHERSSAAVTRVRTAPDATDPEWHAALKDLTATLDYLKAADPLVRAALAEVDAKDAEDAARRVHADAHTFRSFHRPGEQSPAGWTFRTGHGARARYGVVTAGADVAPIGLYEYVTTAERAFLQAEKDAQVEA